MVEVECFTKRLQVYGRHLTRLVMHVICKRAALEIEVIELNKKQSMLIYFDRKRIANFREYILNKSVRKFW